MSGRKPKDPHLSSLMLPKEEFLGIAETYSLHLGLAFVCCCCYCLLFGLVLEREVLFLLRSAFCPPKKKNKCETIHRFQKGCFRNKKHLGFCAKRHTPRAAPNLTGHSGSIRIRSSSLRHAVSPESLESPGIAHQAGLILSAWDPSFPCAC